MTADEITQGIAKIGVISDIYKLSQEVVWLEVMRHTERLLDAKYSSVPVWPKNLDELIKE